MLQGLRTADPYMSLVYTRCWQTSTLELITLTAIALRLARASQLPDVAVTPSTGNATCAGTLSAGAAAVTTLTASGEIAGTSGVAISGGTANTSVDIALPNTNFLAWYDAAATGATTAYIQGSGGAITVNGSSLTFSGGNSDFLANNITTTGTLSAGATDCYDADG
jgi:hypothetical protein